MTSSRIIIADFAYKGLKRSRRGTGYRGLRATLKYLQYRDKRNNHLAQSHEYERWQDRGLGLHHRDIYQHCDQLRSPHVLAWTWVISPAPDLMALVPEEQHRILLYALTERIVEDYYSERGFDIPEYSFLMHSAQTHPKDGEAPQEHLHTHVILPGTAPSAAERLPVYNNASKGHDRLFQQIASHHFADALDQTVGVEWRRLREAPEHDDARPMDSDAFFSR